MPTRDIIVIGASAGGLEALVAIVKGLPNDLRAAIVVVLHTAPDFHSNLPGILSSAGKLPAAFAEDGRPLINGHIRVARPDLHLLVRDRRLTLSGGGARKP